MFTSREHQINTQHIIGFVEYQIQIYIVKIKPYDFYFKQLFLVGYFNIFLLLCGVRHHDDHQQTKRSIK